MREHRVRSRDPVWRVHGRGAVAGPVRSRRRALIAIGVLIVKNWDTIKAATAAVWAFMQRADAILNAIQTVWNWIRQLAHVARDPDRTGGTCGLLITRNWDTIKDAISAVLNWIRDTWNRVYDFLTAPIKRAVDWIGGLIGGIGDTVGRIVGAIKGPVNAVLRAWNGIEFKVPEVNVGPIHFGGQTIGLPDIPLLASGGAVMRTGLAIVHRETFCGSLGGGT